MENEDRTAIKVQALSDLELAVLVCLVADQHCIIETSKDLIDDVEAELQLVIIVDSILDGASTEMRSDCARSVRPLMYSTKLHREHHP